MQIQHAPYHFQKRWCYQTNFKWGSNIVSQKTHAFNHVSNQHWNMTNRKTHVFNHVYTLIPADSFSPMTHGIASASSPTRWSMGGCGGKMKWSQTNGIIKCVVVHELFIKHLYTSTLLVGGILSLFGTSTWVDSWDLAVELYTGQPDFLLPPRRPKT